MFYFQDNFSIDKISPIISPKKEILSRNKPILRPISRPVSAFLRNASNKPKIRNRPKSAFINPVCEEEKRDKGEWIKPKFILRRSQSSYMNPTESSYKKVRPASSNTCLEIETRKNSMSLKNLYIEKLYAIYDPPKK